MLEINLNKIWIMAAIGRLKQLESSVQGYSIRHASGHGSGDVVRELERLEDVTRTMQITFGELINASVACLENYCNQMSEADEHTAEQFIGEGLS